MASRGKAETERLRANCEDQLSRLLSQLQDLEELRDDLDEDEYRETKQETILQLKEFQASLKKMTSGDISLVDELASVQLAIQAAVSEAFSTPEVIQMFAKSDKEQLRVKLLGLQQQLELGKMQQSAYNQQAIEILTVLQHLGEELSAAEKTFLEKHMSKAMAAFQASSNEMGASAAQAVLGAAKVSIEGAKK